MLILRPVSCFRKGWRHRFAGDGLQGGCYHSREEHVGETTDRPPSHGPGGVSFVATRNKEHGNLRRGSGEARNKAGRAGHAADAAVAVDGAAGDAGAGSDVRLAGGGRGEVGTAAGDGAAGASRRGAVRGAVAAAAGSFGRERR